MGVYRVLKLAAIISQIFKVHRTVFNVNKLFTFQSQTELTRYTDISVSIKLLNLCCRRLPVYLIKYFCHCQTCLRLNYTFICFQQINGLHMLAQLNNGHCDANKDPRLELVTEANSA